MEDDMLVYYDDKPFTGEVVARDGEGRMVSLVTYLEGMESGPQTHWYSDGTKKAEGAANLGTPMGEWLKWHPNGQLSERSVFNPKGRYVQRQRWDKSGNLTLDKSYNP
ncbi:toxin-antitoxin system YwqK family antitoxin [Streptomyces sp. S186]|uniref:toxin-antitoxin system YwqK family antitoxin n=1 Tax=Streptomyces sp. S186 TaxID=3434395 RepID=UPI003F67CBBE